MTDKPASPFAGLDKALLRSTQARAPEQPVSAETTSAAPQLAPPAKPKRQSVKAAAPRKAERAAEPDAATLGFDEIGAIQQALKAIGKEIYYIRVTPEEKGRVEDIIYTFKRQGVRTSVNEIGRIALNYLLADYDAHGEHSFLGRVLATKRA
jgi:hypothetical protein